MSELTIEQRVAAGVAVERPVHVICCNPNLAECGLDVSDRPFLPNETPTTCPVCAIAEAEDLPCDDPDCPYREEGVSS